MVVLEGTNLMGARRCAEKLREVIANAFIETAGGVVRVTVSIGISGTEGMIDRGAATVQLLLEHADANLYKSKAGGRNRVSFSSLSSVPRGARDSTKHGVTHDNAQMPVSVVR